MYNLERLCKKSPYSKSNKGQSKMIKDLRGVRYYLHHRYIYAEYYDVDLEPEDVIRHLCNNPGCIEITHLSKGGRNENVKDARDAGTHNTVKLTLEEVEEIRDLYKVHHWTQIEIAREFDISRSHVASLMSEKHWQPNPPVPEQEVQS